jgi:flagellar biosynthetic protein FlhB
MPGPDAQEKTEQPTAKRRNKARQDGHVPASQDMTSAIILIVLLTIVYLRGPAVTEWAFGEMRSAFSLDHMKVSDQESFVTFMNEKIVTSVFIMLPIMSVLAGASLITSLWISGKTFNPGKAFEWKLSNFNPVKSFKSLFSVKSLVKMGLSILKIIFITAITYFYIRKKIIPITTFQWAWDMDILRAMCGMIVGVSIRICAAVLILGIIDLIYQKWSYIKGLKMTKQEVKEERKQAEGPPEIKRKLRQIQMQTAMRRMMKEVPDADVVLVNPTHVAVALKYDADKMSAPTVVAKGGGNVCEKIKDTARAYGVPIIRRPALARNLFATVGLNDPIPDALYVAVAEVLALVHRIRNRRGS